jgi:hypothetical protein
MENVAAALFGHLEKLKKECKEQLANQMLTMN